MSQIKSGKNGKKSQASFYKGVAFTGSSTIFYILALFLEMMIAVRLLSKESYGVYVLLITVVHFLLMLVDFGMQTSIVHFIAKSDNENQASVVNSVMIFRCLIIGLITPLLFSLKQFIYLIDASEQLGQFVGFIPVMLFVASYDELNMSFLQGFQNFKGMAIASILRSSLRVLLSGIFLYFFKWETYGLIYSFLISFSLSALYQFVRIPVSKRIQFQKTVIQEVLRFGAPIQIGRFLWFVMARINVILLGSLAGPSSVAFYAVASRIPTALRRLAEAYLKVYFPKMTLLISKGDKTKALELFNQSLRLLSFFMAFAALFATLFSREIVILVFSPKYEASGIVFSILMIALHMSFLVMLMGYTLTSAGYPTRSLVENVIRTSITVVSNVLLIPVFGFVGAGYANLIANYISNPVTIVLLRKSHIGPKIYSYVTQTSILWLCVGIFWIFRPDFLIYRILLLIIFIVLNLMFSTFSIHDLRTVVPKRVLDRIFSYIYISKKKGIK